MWSGRAPQIITEASASKEMADCLTSEEELIYKGGDIPSQENDLKKRENDLNIKEFQQALGKKRWSSWISL